MARFFASRFFTARFWRARFWHGATVQAESPAALCLDARMATQLELSDLMTIQLKLDSRMTTQLELNVGC